MWLLHLLPDSFLEFVVDAILLLGAIGCFLSFFVLNRILRFIPPLANYYKIAQLISVVVLLAGVYFKGGYSTEMIWRDRVKELQKDIADAEERARHINTVTVEKIITKTKIIKQKGDTVIEYIEKGLGTNPEIQKFVASCPIPQDIVKTHNISALGQGIEVKK